VPAHDRFRRNDDERLFPFRPQSEGGDPEQFVNDAKVRTPPSSFQDDELLTKNQVFQSEASTTAKQPNERPTEGPNELEHGAEL
jgi:hypothetical protein